MIKKIQNYFDTILFLLSPEAIDVEWTEEEIQYFREHPEEIDDFTSPLKIHKFFLLVGVILGILLVGVSKVFKFSSLMAEFHEGWREFTVDIVFETGVALIGAAVTAYLLGIILNQRQDSAMAWRNELRKRINLDTEDGETETSS